MTEFHERLVRHRADHSEFAAACTANDATAAVGWAGATPYPFAALLDNNEIREVVNELAETLRKAAETGSLEAYEGTLAAWRSTAETIADPAALAAALAAIDYGSAVPLPTRATSITARDSAGRES